METKMKQLLRRHGLPAPEFQYVDPPITASSSLVSTLHIPELRIAIEYDSYEHHTGKLAIVRDNDRRNQLRNIRWDSSRSPPLISHTTAAHALKALRTGIRRHQCAVVAH